jgi:hypothetical protein
MTEQISKLVGWLRSTGAKQVSGCVVKIGKHTFAAARYLDKQHKEAHIYAIGMLPKTMERKTCFPFDNQEWFRAGYIKPEGIKPEFAEYHPFGANFILMPWQVPSGEAIDKYEQKPYRRVPMTVSAL